MLAVNNLGYTMKLFFILILLSFNYTLTFAQTSSLEVIMDPRAIAMGESFAANPSGLIHADNNPALLSQIKNNSAYYSRRNINWISFLDNFVYYSIGASGRTPIGNFALTYKRYNTGEVSYSTLEEPDITSGKVASYYHNFILTYAYQLSEHFSFGINAKTHSYIMNVIQGDLQPADSNVPILLDAGILYSFNPIDNEEISKVNLGAALFNYGMDFKSKTTGVGESFTRIEKLPRFCKLGIEYEFKFQGKK